MSKARTTQKAIKAAYKGDIISVGYGKLQQMLSCMEPNYYNAGIYGWNWDLYDVCGVAIVTGYRTFGYHNADAGICKKYEEKADFVLRQNLSYQEVKNVLYSLAMEFVDEVMHG
jgi:hypothetical protein